MREIRERGAHSSSWGRAAEIPYTVADNIRTMVQRIERYTEIADWCRSSRCPALPETPEIDEFLANNVYATFSEWNCTWIWVKTLDYFSPRIEDLYKRWRAVDNDTYQWAARDLKHAFKVQYDNVGSFYRHRFTYPEWLFGGD